MAGEYRVVGPVAVVRVAGRRVALDRGASVPEGADEAHLAHLLDVGLVVAGSASEVEPEVEPEIEPEPAKAPVKAPAKPAAKS